MPDSPTPDYYKILQVDPSAEQEVITAAFKGLAKKYHPDVYHGSDRTERMREINLAYEVLGDPGKRQAYDYKRQSRIHNYGSTQWSTTKRTSSQQSEYPHEQTKQGYTSTQSTRKERTEQKSKQETSAGERSTGSRTSDFSHQEGSRTQQSVPPQPAPPKPKPQPTNPNRRKVLIGLGAAGLGLAGLGIYEGSLDPKEYEIAVGQSWQVQANLNSMCGTTWYPRKPSSIITINSITGANFAGSYTATSDYGDYIQTVHGSIYFDNFLFKLFHRPFGMWTNIKGLAEDDKGIWLSFRDDRESWDDAYVFYAFANKNGTIKGVIGCSGGNTPIGNF